ncbi:hypothetical protein QCA50_018029 [Cerrena zonata]|uniref:Uncharacterized protein n=1 Tax=Cerrena zonata TaxID=2478898 RepID=A0AAW0FIU9_9APHY
MGKETSLKSSRHRFTSGEDMHLIGYLAQYGVDDTERGSSKRFKLLTNNPTLYPWASTHSSESWRSHYAKKKSQFDNAIMTKMGKEGRRVEKSPSSTSTKNTDDETVRISQGNQLKDPAEGTSTSTTTTASTSTSTTTTTTTISASLSSSTLSLSLGKEDDLGDEMDQPITKELDEYNRPSDGVLSQQTAQSQGYDESQMMLTPIVEVSDTDLAGRNDSDAIQNCDEEAYVEPIWSPTGWNDPHPTPAGNIPHPGQTFGDHPLNFRSTCRVVNGTLRGRKISQNDIHSAMSETLEMLATHYGFSSAIAHKMWKETGTLKGTDEALKRMNECALYKGPKCIGEHSER